MGLRLSLRRASAVVIAGTLWAQTAIAVRTLVLAKYLPLGDRIAEGLAGRVASWTLLCPLEAALWCTAPIARSSTGAVPAWAALWLCQLIGISICTFVAAGALSNRWRRAVVSGVAAVALVGTACGAVVAAQLRDAFVAEKAFFAMMSRAVEPQKDAAIVSACRDFVERHERSRWAGEALRIVAMAEWDAGRIAASEQLWQRFAERFRDRECARRRVRRVQHGAVRAEARRPCRRPAPPSRRPRDHPNAR